MGRVVELRQFGELDLDDVLVDGKRVGLLPHCDNAALRLVVKAEPAVAAEVRTRCAELRAEQGRPPIAERIMGVPNSDEIRAYEKKRKAAK